MVPEARGTGVDRTAKRRLTAEHIAARALVESATFGEAAPKILQAICEALGWEYGAFWRIDQETQILRCVNTWASSPSDFPEFDRTSRQITFGRGIGLPGRVWNDAQPTWIPDVVLDMNFPRADIAAREGLHGAFGFPILLRGDVQSVMEFFSRDIRAPDEDLLSMLTSVGNQIGLYVDRRRAQEELDRFFMLSLDLLCVVGVDGFFKRVNPAWQRILGYTEAELLSRPYIELIHPDDREATSAQAASVANGHALMYFENRYVHKDGTIRWLLWTATPFPQQQIMYASARDITERKAAEETLASYARELERSQRALEEQTARLVQLVKELELAKSRAEEAADTKSAFLANMSHEVRTPLNAIMGMTTLALQTKLSSEQQEYLETVKSSADSLLAIVNDILDFSRIEARRLDLEHAEFDLREVVGDAAKVLGLRAGEKGLELACHIAAETPDVVLGDAGRLRQVLLNVLGNAVKFTDAGEVVLDVDVDSESPARVSLRFAVTDTGIGIPAGKQRDIFQAFTQADSSTTRRFGGTGLGLAIALRLVELMGGRMWVQSEVGRGSTFSFTANFDRPQDVDREPIVDKAGALDGLRVLVVDDNATNRRILEEMLASWHMTPTTAADAESALAALRGAIVAQNPFDVIIADLQMPIVDGFMLARRVRHDRQLARTPIVMLTSVGHGGETAARRGAAVDAYLTKPVKHSDLLDALATLFRVATRRPGGNRESKPDAKPARRLRILVAEDNLVNRKLVTKLLQKRGHYVDAVENGRAALDMIESAVPAGYDVVLMDLQMPEMGGFEATAAIRERERRGGGHVPVIALTAHAMAGDRERCLAAGMDAYLSKPIEMNDLIATVERSTEGAAAPGEPASSGHATLFDEKAALKYAGGDRRLLKQVVSLFRSDAVVSLRRMKHALDRRESEALRMAAHGLKGAIATVGSPAGRDAAAQVELLARANRFDDAEPAYADLRALVRRLDIAFGHAGLVTRSEKKRARPARRPSGKRSRS